MQLYDTKPIQGLSILDDDDILWYPMFGRFVTEVILPKDDSFDHSKMKDSKKFTSENKINFFLIKVIY